MNNAVLSQILLKISRLPAVDQRWILSKLSENQRKRLKNESGITWLQELQGLKTEPVIIEKKLPSCAYDLAIKPPLYSAIVLEQGDYSWEDDFLQEFDKEGAIQECLKFKAPALKLLTKQAVFQDWQTMRSFDSYLEKNHG